MRAAIILLLATGVAHADTVLAVDGKDIYIDLGANDGVGAGSELELLHEIVATDPVTKHQLHDQFALGTLSVAKAGDKVCVAHADGELAKRVLAGDHVRLVSPKKQFVDPWAERVAASKPAPAVATTAKIDHVALAREAWQATLGLPPEQRVARWQKFLADDPGSPFKKAVDVEIASLQKQAAARDAALAKARSAAPDDTSPRVADLVKQLDPSPAMLLAAPIDRAVPDRAIELAFLARSPAEIAHAWLYVRRHGEPGFRRVELRRDGDAYLRGTIDRDVVREPSVEWYVETSAKGEDSTAAIGSHEAPELIAVQPIVTEPPPQAGRSHIDLHVDYVDWTGKLSDGYDRYYQAEADFTYRFLDPVYAVRLGFGTLSGIGGPKDFVKNPGCIDPSDGSYRCTAVTFSYVYMEVEHRLARNIAIMWRPQFGSLTTNVMTTSTNPCDQPGAEMRGCQFLTGFGLRGRLRLGEESGTNLVLGASFSRGVGTLLEAAYHWLPHPVVPVQITVQVTDQPVLEDFGVRLIGDVGIRKLGWFYPSLRASYQARDIHHTGVSGGLAMNFDW